VSAGYLGYGPSGRWNYPVGTWGGWGGWGGYGGAAAMAGDSTTETFSLANGVGPESVMKQAMAMQMAQQATPEYAAKIDRNYDMAVLRATASPTLRVALGMPTTEDAQKEDGVYRRLGAEIVPAGAVMVTLKDGEKIQAKKVTTSGDWYILQKADGTREQIRQSEVTRIQGGAGGIIPAAGG
jgi:hypothetical protein